MINLYIIPKFGVPCTWVVMSQMPAVGVTGRLPDHEEGQQDTGDAEDNVGDDVRGEEQRPGHGEA